MSKYTTGELAKIAGVSVRTVQYYDTRNILSPSELTEGGRRLYSEDDLIRLKAILFLKDLGLPLNTVSELLKEETSSEVITLIFDEQEKEIRKEIDELKNRLSMISELRKAIKENENFSVKAMSGIADYMQNKKKLRKVRINMLITGIPLEIVEIGTVIYWVRTGTWWPFAAWFVVQIIAATFLVKYYHRNVSYICPKCHEVFKPSFREMFWANHTPTTRKLTCPHCHTKGFCVETYGEEDENE